jgi:ATP-dependent Clp protease ATP-binding subunit ClpC
MASHQYPVLVWEDNARLVTGALVEDWGGASAIGVSEREVLDQLEEFIAWKGRKEFYPDPVLLDLNLTWFSIPIRPVYIENVRMFSCDEVIPMRVPCVHGRLDSGMLIAAIPSLGVRFHYHAAEKLKPLVEHHVKEHFGKVTPQQLTRCLPPKDVRLTFVTVRGSRPSAERSTDAQYRTLEAVAEALAGRNLRRQFSKPWDREAEVTSLITRLEKERASVILVGPSGVGKTSVLAETVRRIEHHKADTGDGEDKKKPPGHRFWLTQAARIIAGMKYLGQWEERCENVIAELSSCEGTLCVENLLELLGIGGSGPTDSIAAFMMPYLQRGELRIAGECTPEELDACRRLLPGFAELFQIQKIEPFDAQRALHSLQMASSVLVQNSKFELEGGLVPLIYRLFARFRPYDAFPGNAMRFLSGLFEDARRHKLDEIKNADVISAFIQQTGIPELFLRDDLPFDAKDPRGYFQSQVIGQDAPCQTAVNLITMFKAGLNDPNRPLGVLLFCGPTGVGKTELARAIARYLFGHGESADERLIRLDMSEYAESFSAERLLGTPHEPSDLIKKIRRQPFSVVLFDEIEKASPDVFDVLLGLFDEGRLTDSFGRVTWFRSAVIILTSNFGAYKQNVAGFVGERYPSYQTEALSFFRPEFFNRIDDVVSFQTLSAAIIRQITEKELASIADRDGLKHNAITLKWSAALVEHLSQAGFDKRYGARPLQRTIERLVIAPLSRYLIANSKLRRIQLALDFDSNDRVTVELLNQP